MVRFDAPMIALEPLVIVRIEDVVSVISDSAKSLGAAAPPDLFPFTVLFATLASLLLVTALAAMVAAKLAVPLPVTSPVSVIVWSPVLVPDKLDAEMLPVKVLLPEKDCVVLFTKPGSVVEADCKANAVPSMVAP